MPQVTGDCYRPDCPLERPLDATPVSEGIRQRLAEAYAAQSQSDFRVYQQLPRELPECHRLHYLQMACEKIAKAYRLRDTQTIVEREMSSHIAFSKFVGNLLSSNYIKQRYLNQSNKLRQIASMSRKFAQEIEKLAPAVDRIASPANVEYPWVQNESVFTPCTSTYSTLTQLYQREGREFLQIVQTAIENFDEISIS